jgi:cystathionine beta-synthase
MRNNKFLPEKAMANEEEKPPSTVNHPLRSPIGDESLFDFGDITIAQLNLPKPICVSSNTSCKEAAALMSAHNFSQLPVVSSPGSSLVGLITMGQILSKVAHKICSIEDSVDQIMFKFNRRKNYVEVRAEWQVKRLLSFFDSHSIAIVTDDEGEVVCVVTKFDLVEFLLRKSK